MKRGSRGKRLARKKPLHVRKSCCLYVGDQPGKKMGTQNYGPASAPRRRAGDERLFVDPVQASAFDPNPGEKSSPLSLFVSQNALSLCRRLSCLKPHVWEGCICGTKMQRHRAGGGGGEGRQRRRRRTVSTASTGLRKKEGGRGAGGVLDAQTAF